jgi:Zn finger protein HypA/HybF involved in hydrogenase expression
LIEPIKGLRGQEQALCKCDECAAQVVYAAPHGKGNGRNGQRNLVLTLARPSVVVEKLRKIGWTEIKGKLRCPKCDAKRNEITPEKEIEVKQPATVTELRQPTQKQKREIVAMLMEVYDEDLKRYRGHETDKTVAETLEGGVMPGWVAAIREDMFGPAGTNDEMESLMAELTEWRASGEKAVKNARLHIENAESVVRKMEEELAKVAALEKRQAAIIRAVGPKAQRA